MRPRRYRSGSRLCRRAMAMRERMCAALVAWSSLPANNAESRMMTTLASADSDGLLSRRSRPSSRKRVSASR
jgi:hypothetical protein